MSVSSLSLTWASCHLANLRRREKGRWGWGWEEGSLEGDVCIIVLEETEDGLSSCLSQILIPKSKLGLKISTLWLSSLRYIF